MKIFLFVGLASVLSIAVIAAPKKKHHTKRDGLTVEIDLPTNETSPLIPIFEVPLFNNTSTKHGIHRKHHLKRDGNDTQTDGDTANPTGNLPGPQISSSNTNHLEANPISATIGLFLTKHKPHQAKHHEKREGGDTTDSSNDNKQDDDSDKSGNDFDPLKPLKDLEDKFSTSTLPNYNSLPSKTRISG